MLIGIRIVLLVGVILAAIAILGFLFTRKPRMLHLAKVISATTLILVSLIGLLYFVERVLLK
ncbi:MAG: hypothetical protein ACKVQK_25115 [Burkholderiales bacterium]|jgi:hypothetical protein